MTVGRDTIREAALASVGVVVFLAFLVAAAMLSPNGIGEAGAYVMVGSIVAFVLAMAVIGVLFIDKE
ncbi:MAG: hypothetical protein ABEJ44_06425 [Halanaeroarchaeum sp.]